MPWTRYMKSMTVVAFVLAAFWCGAAGAKDNMETRRIDFLISSVQNLAGAKFVRNDAEYGGQEAADHLRMKLKRAAGRVQTAEDFIRLCASRSYVTRRPYAIRLSSGETVQADEFFRKKLKEFDSSKK